MEDDKILVSDYDIISELTNIVSAHILTTIKSFVFASSCSVYGEGSDKPRNEQDEVKPFIKKHK